VISNFDNFFLKMYHELAKVAGQVLTPFFSFISFITDNAIIFILLSLVLMLFKKTRKIGVCMFGAIGLSSIIAYFLKDLIARPRPFETDSMYAFWHTFVESPTTSGYSYPSGHVTGTMAAMTALFLTTNKKRSWTSFLVVLLVAISRNYLIVHYPTDVIGGILVGLISAFAAYLITKIIFKFLEKRKENKLFNFLLNFDLLNRK